MYDNYYDYYNEEQTDEIPKLEAKTVTRDRKDDGRFGSEVDGGP